MEFVKLYASEIRLIGDGFSRESMDALPAKCAFSPGLIPSTEWLTLWGSMDSVPRFIRPGIFFR